MHERECSPHGPGSASDLSPARRPPRPSRRAVVLPRHRVRSGRRRRPRRLPRAHQKRCRRGMRRGFRLLRHGRVPRADPGGVRGVRARGRGGDSGGGPRRGGRRLRYVNRPQIRGDRRGRGRRRTARDAALPGHGRPGGPAAPLLGAGRGHRPGDHRLPARQRCLHPRDRRRTRQGRRHHRPQGRPRRPRSDAAHPQRRTHRPARHRLPLLQRPAHRRTHRTRLPRHRHHPLLLRRLRLRARDSPRVPPRPHLRRRHNREQPHRRLLPAPGRTALQRTRIRRLARQGGRQTARLRRGRGTHPAERTAARAHQGAHRDHRTRLRAAPRRGAGEGA